MINREQVMLLARFSLVLLAILYATVFVSGKIDGVVKNQAQVIANQNTMLEKIRALESITYTDPELSKRIKQLEIEQTIIEKQVAENSAVMKKFLAMEEQLTKQEKK